MNAKSIESAGSKVVLVMDSIPYGGDMDPTLALNLHEDIPCSGDFLLQREDDMVEKQSGGCVHSLPIFALKISPFQKLTCHAQFSHVLLVITPQWGTRRAPEFVWGTRLD